MVLSAEEKLRRARERYHRMKVDRPEVFSAVKQRKGEVTRRWNADQSADPIKRAANAQRMRLYRAFRSRQKSSLPVVIQGGPVAAAATEDDARHQAHGAGEGGVAPEDGAL
jgi:hypothetical protein